MRTERAVDRLGQPVAVGDEVWDLGCSLERHQNLLKHGTVYVRRGPVVACFDWGVRVRKTNGDEMDSQCFEWAQGRGAEGIQGCMTTPQPGCVAQRSRGRQGTRSVIGGGAFPV